MDAEKKNSKTTKLEEPSVNYETTKIKFKGIDRAIFDFNEEVKNGYTPEEFKAEMFKRIEAYPWKK
ncbi:hypothetical protein [Flavobacterium glaciei]|uniref:Uncharacterized protein n=1 Tax=Flavobacterium glaciei TaxID=386300 RepID=A0A562PRX8_9FLAO|nr:hypothetical protein [Flavobacterium glaciei]RDI54773.1 hypothetical protein DFR66_107101 [Flavobacterium glaciei]TWI47159.1 hypothetical protein IQ02_01609 [Flavobacterium glaciei]